MNEWEIKRFSSLTDEYVFINYTTGLCKYECCFSPEEMELMQNKIKQWNVVYGQ
ncbi:hypothetical protein [Paenibacillus durus]|uniref:hypothetical protein n=1 Tax=Paenibacillus durus TaxID=44251 RepID=UPI0004B8D0F6|nr:hypothetical protein [Paenibacillus durus]